VEESLVPPPRRPPIEPEAPIASLAVGDLRLSAYDLTPGSESHAHEHGAETWVLGASGALELPSARARPLIRAGVMLRIPDDLVHCERVGPHGSRCFLLRPGAATLERLLHGGRAQPSPVDDPELAELARRMTRLVHEHEPLAEVEAEGAALLALALASRLERDTGKAPSPWLRRVRDALDDDPGQRWTHHDLARLAGVTPEHLARRFRATYGCTIATHLRRRRLARARQLLLETSANLTSIALATGFADHSHLTRSFRAAFGTTPSAYRAARRRGA
jgi:AraC-like DNA-binding protein